MSFLGLISVVAHHGVPFSETCTGRGKSKSDRGSGCESEEDIRERANMRKRNKSRKDGLSFIFGDTGCGNMLSSGSTRPSLGIFSSPIVSSALSPFSSPFSSPTKGLKSLTAHVEEELDEFLNKYGGRLLGGASEEPSDVPPSDQLVSLPSMASMDPTDQPSYDGTAVSRTSGTFMDRLSTWNAKDTIVASTMFAEGLQEGALLAIFYLMKDTYDMSPAEVSFYIAMTMAPWLFKPFWAFLSDTMPINGQRRKPYLIIYSLVQFASYVALGFSGSMPFWATMTFLVTHVVGRSGVVSVAQALLVERASGGSGVAASELVSEFFLLRSAGCVVTAWLTGALLGVTTPAILLGSFAVIPVATLILIFRWHEPVVGDFLRRQVSGITQTDYWMLVRNILSKNVVWVPLLALFMFGIGPNFDDALFFYYINVLNFQPEFMGRIQLVHAIARVIAVLMYRTVFTDVNFKPFMFWTTIVAFPLYITPALITSGAYTSLGLSPKFLALSGELVREAFLSIQMLPALAIVSSRSPKGLEGSIFSMFTVILNVGKSIQRINSWVFIQLFGITNTNFDNLTAYIIFCGETLFLGMPVLLMMDDDIGEHKQASVAHIHNSVSRWESVVASREGSLEPQAIENDDGTDKRIVEVFDENNPSASSAGPRASASAAFAAAAAAEKSDQSSNSQDSSGPDGRGGGANRVRRGSKSSIDSNPPPAG